MAATCPRCRSRDVVLGGDGVSYICRVCHNAWVSADLQNVADEDALGGTVRFSRDAALFGSAEATRAGQRRHARSQRTWVAVAAGLSDERFVCSLALEYFDFLRDWYLLRPFTCEKGFAARRPSSGSTAVPTSSAGRAAGLEGPRSFPLLPAPLVPPSSGLVSVPYGQEFSSARDILSQLFARHRAILGQLSRAVGARLSGKAYSRQKLWIQRKCEVVLRKTLAGAAAADPDVDYCDLRPAVGSLLSKHLSLPAALALLAAQLAGVPADVCDLVAACRARAYGSALSASQKLAATKLSDVSEASGSTGSEDEACDEIDGNRADRASAGRRVPRDGSDSESLSGEAIGADSPAVRPPASPATGESLTPMGAVAARAKLSKTACRRVLRTITFLLVPDPVRISPSFDIRPRVLSLAREICDLVQTGFSVQGLSPAVSGLSLLIAARLPSPLPGCHAWRRVPTIRSDRSASAAAWGSGAAGISGVSAPVASTSITGLVCSAGSASSIFQALSVCMSGTEVFSAMCVGIGFCMAVQFYALVGAGQDPDVALSKTWSQVRERNDASHDSASTAKRRSLAERFLLPSCISSWDAVSPFLRYSKPELFPILRYIKRIGLPDAASKSCIARIAPSTRLKRSGKSGKRSDFFRTLLDSHSARRYRFLASVYHRSVYVSAGSFAQGNRGKRHAVRLDQLFGLLDRVSEVISVSPSGLNGESHSLASDSSWNSDVASDCENLSRSPDRGSQASARGYRNTLREERSKATSGLVFATSSLPGRNVGSPASERQGGPGAAVAGFSVGSFCLRPFAPLFLYDPRDLVENDCLVFRRAASVLAARAELPLERFVYILAALFGGLMEGRRGKPRLPTARQTEGA